MRFMPLVVLLVGVGGCALTSGAVQAGRRAGTSAAALAGCYRVELGPWTETGQHKGFVPFTEFRLDTLASTSSVAPFHAREAAPEVVRTALPEITGRRPGPGVWYRIGTDSLFVEWHNGNVSGGYRLVARGDSVVGRAVTWSHWRPLREGMQPEDVIDPTAPARGRRVPCRG